MSKPIAIIVQRYGAQVNGGAEAHARLIAEQLEQQGERVVVLTSQALDYHTWAPHFPEGETELNGVRIKRFATGARKADKIQRHFRRRARERTVAQRIYKAIGRPGWISRMMPDLLPTEEDHAGWLEAQGPFLPDMVAYLEQHLEKYKVFIFFTALYYPTAAGILVTGKKSILVPTMHDEPASYMPGYQTVMQAPAFLFFNTTAEQQFCEQLFSIGQVKKRIAGVGIELFTGDEQAAQEVLAKWSITDPYLIYVGRIDKSKGCHLLLHYFQQFRRSIQSPLQLVMVGKNVMKEQPALPGVTYTGFVTEEEKRQLMLNATVLAMPSVFESLSLVLLESFGCRVPVIANGKADVLREHIEQSGGGWCYTTEGEFISALKAAVTDDEECLRRGKAGYTYVKEKYTWPRVMAQFREAIDYIEKSGK